MPARTRSDGLQRGWRFTRGARAAVREAARSRATAGAAGAACEALERRMMLSVNTPTGLVGARISGTEARLMWGDNSNEDSFIVERRMGQSTATPEILNVEPGWAESYEWTDDGLVPGTSYFYQVKGVKAGSADSPSSQMILVISSPGSPGSPGRPFVRAAGSDTLNLAWSDNVSNETGYAVERSTDNGATWLVLTTLWANATTYVDDTASPSTSYTYRVKAVGPNTYSPTSFAVTTPAPESAPAAPSGLTAVGFDESQIKVSWTDNSSNETEFRLEYSDNGGSTYQQVPAGNILADSTSYHVNGLNPAKRYTFRLRATNGGGDSGYSNTASVWSAFQYGAVTADSRGRTHAMRVSWPDASGEAGYEVWRRKNGFGTWVLAASLGANVTQFDDKGKDEPGGVLAEDTYYEYGVVIKAGVASEDSTRSRAWQTTAQFKLIDMPQAEWNPQPGHETELLDLPGKPNVYDEQWICVGPVQWMMQLSADPYAQDRCEAIARAGKNVVIDIEHWPEDQRDSGAGPVQEAIDDFKQVIAWIRAEWAEMMQEWVLSGGVEGMDTSGLRLGLYDAGVNRPRSYEDHNDPSVMDAWRDANDVFAELIEPFTVGGQTWDGLDFLAPEFYVSGTNWSEWIGWTRLMLEESRRLGDEHGIPVYVIVHPRDAFTWDEVPVDMWRYELESIRSIADGVAVWYGPSTSPLYPLPVDKDPDQNYTNDPWYDELEEFRDQWDRLPPGAPSVPAVDQYGPFVSWTDSAVEDAGHDARGWVIERSRNGTDWVPVGGGYAGDEQTVHDYWARNDTSDYRYRVRAINAFGSTAGAVLGPVTTHRDASRIEAELTDDRHSAVTSGSTLNHTFHSTWTRYNDVSFDGTEERLLMRYFRLNTSTIHVWAMPPGTSVTIGSNGWSVLGTGVTEIATEPVQGSAQFEEFEVALSSFPSGVRDVMLTFQGGPEGATLVQLDWMQFLPAEGPAPGTPIMVGDDTAEDGGTLAVTDANGGVREKTRPPAVRRPRVAARVSVPERKAAASPFATRRRAIFETVDESVLT